MATMRPKGTEENKATGKAAADRGRRLEEETSQRSGGEKRLKDVVQVRG